MWRHISAVATTSLLTLMLIAPGPAMADHHQDKSQDKKEGQQSQQSEDGWQDLFNGKNLDGWSVRSGEAEYRVEDHAIVGRTVKGSPNSFLTTDEQFEDFELRFEVKIDDDELNSGVQIRSKLRGDKFGGRLHGPQVEVEASPGDAGFIYGEAIGGWLSKPSPDQKIFKNDQWNEFRVLARGDRIKTWVNGESVADLKLPSDIAKDHSEGRIGLQVHGVGSDGPFQVRWRNIKIKPLSGSSEKGSDSEDSS